MFISDLVPFYNRDRSTAPDNLRHNESRTTMNLKQRGSVLGEGFSLPVIEILLGKDLSITREKKFSEALSGQTRSLSLLQSPVINHVCISSATGLLSIPLQVGCSSRIEVWSLCSLPRNLWITLTRTLVKLMLLT